MLDHIRAEIYRGAKKLRFFKLSGAIIRFIFILIGVSNGSRLSAKNLSCPALNPSFKTRYLGYSYQTPSEQELSFLNHSENCSFPVSLRYRFSALNVIHHPWMSGYLHVPDKRKFNDGFLAWSKFLNAMGATWECGGKIGPQSQLRYQWHAMIGLPKIQTLEFSHRRWTFQLFHIFNGSKQSIRQFQIRHRRRWLNAHWLQSRIILQNAPNRWAELIIQFKIVLHANSRAYFPLSSALDAIYASKVGLSARLLSDSKQAPPFHSLNVDKMAYPAAWINRLETTETEEVCDEKQYFQCFEPQEEDGQESHKNLKIEALSCKAGPISQIQIRAPPIPQRQSQRLKDASFSETTIKKNRLDSLNSEALCFQASTASGDEKSIEGSIGTFSLPCEEKPIVKISDRFQCLEAPKRNSSAKDERRDLNEEHFFSPSSLILHKDASSLKPTPGSNEIALQAGMARLEGSEQSSQKQFAWRLPKNLYPHSPSPVNAPSNECIAEVAPWKNSNGERNTGFFKLPITSRQAKSWMKRDISALPGEGFFECASPDRQGISYNRVSLAQLTMFSSKIIQLNSAQAQCIVLDCGQDSSNAPISLKMIVVGQPTALVLLHESGFNIESLKTHNVLELTLALRSQSHDCLGDAPENSSLKESLCIGHSGICTLDPECLLKKIQLFASNIFVDAPMIAETILMRAGIKIETLEEIFSPSHCLRHSKLNRDGESVAPSLVIGKEAEIRANANILLENGDLNGCIIQEKATPEKLQLHSAHIHLFAWKSIDLCGTIRVMPTTQLERNGLEIQAKELTFLGSIQAPNAQVRWLADNMVLSQESQFEGARLWIERSQKLFSYCLENQWNILEHAQFDVDFWQHFGDLQCQSLSWIGKSFELFGQIKNSKGQGVFFGEDVIIRSEGRLFVEQGELIAQRIAVDSTMQNDLPSVHAKDHLKMIAHHLKLNARIESDHAMEIVALDYLQGGQLRAQGEITITTTVCELAPQVHISSQSQLVCYLNAELHSMFEDDPHQTKVQQAYLHLKRTKLNHLGRLILNEGSSLEAPSINIVKNAQDGLVTYKKSTLSSFFQGSTFSSEPFIQNKCRAGTPFLAGHNIHLNVPVMACETLSLLGDELCLKPECDFAQISRSQDRSMAASHPSWLERLHLYSTCSIEIATSKQGNLGAQSIQFNSPIITLQRNMDAAHDLSLNGKCLDINIELNVKKGKVTLTAEKLVRHENAKLLAMSLEATVKEPILIEHSSLQTPTIWSGDNVQLNAKNIEISAPIVSKMIEIEAKESIKILKNDDQLIEYGASPAQQSETNAKGQGLFAENILQCQSAHIEINQPIYAGQELSINAENQLTVNGAITAPSATIALKGHSIIFGNAIKILVNHFHAQARQRIHSRTDDNNISVVALSDLTLRADELAFEGDWMAYEQFTIQEFKTFSFKGTLHCRRGALSIYALMSDAVNRKKFLEMEMFLGAGTQLRSKEALTLKVSHLKRLPHAAPASCEVTLETLFKSERGIRVNTATLNLSPLCIEAESNVEIAAEQTCHLEGKISSRQGNIMLGCGSESASKERPFLNISPELILEAPAGSLTLDAKKIEIAVMEQHQFKKLYFSKQASEITLNGQVHCPLHFAHPHEITLSGELRSPSALHLNSVGSLTLCAQSQWCAPSIHLKSDQSIKISGTLKHQGNQAAQEIVIESKHLAFGSTGLIIASTLKLSVDQSLKTLPHSQIQQIERFQMRSAEIHLHGPCGWENSAVHLVSSGLLTLSAFSLLKSGSIQLKGKVIQIDKKSHIEAKNMAIESESQCCLAGKIACQEECLLSAKEMVLSENAEIVARDLTGELSESFKIEAHKENKWRVSLSNDAHIDAKVIEIAGGFQAKNNIHLHWMSACRLSGMMHSSEGSLCIRSVNPNRKNCQELSYLQNSTLYLQVQSQLNASQTCHLMAERINVQGNMSASAIHGYAKRVVYDWGAKITQAQQVSWACDDLELREKFECSATLTLLTETLRCLDKSALIAKQIHLSIKNAFHLPKTCQLKGENQVTLKTPKFLNEATIQMGQSSLIEVGELTNRGTFVIRDDTLADNAPFNFYFSPYHSETGEVPPCSIQYTLQQGILSLGGVESASFIHPHLKKVKMGLKRMEKVL